MTLADLRRTGSIAVADSSVARFVTDLLAYGVISVAALACDYGLLIGLVDCGLHYLIASFVSFSAGMAVSYALCVRFVFASRRADSREAEAAGFFAVGVAGLALTQLLLYLIVARGGLPVALAKVPTAGVVFLFNFLGRRGLVFASAAVLRRSP